MLLCAAAKYGWYSGWFDTRRILQQLHPRLAATCITSWGQLTALAPRTADYLLLHSSCVPRLHSLCTHTKLHIKDLTALAATAVHCGARRRRGTHPWQTSSWTACAGSQAVATCGRGRGQTPATASSCAARARLYTPRVALQSKGKVGSTTAGATCVSQCGWRVMQSPPPPGSLPHSLST